MDKNFVNIELSQREAWKSEAGWVEGKRVSVTTLRISQNRSTRLEGYCFSMAKFCLLGVSS